MRPRVPSIQDESAAASIYRNPERILPQLVRATGVCVQPSPAAPILPQGSDWNAAVALRDAARAEILRRCGEPDLAPRNTYETQNDELSGE